MKYTALVFFSLFFFSNVASAFYKCNASFLAGTRSGVRYDSSPLRYTATELQLNEDRTYTWNFPFVGLGNETRFAGTEWEVHVIEGGRLIRSRSIYLVQKGVRTGEEKKVVYLGEATEQEYDEQVSRNLGAYITSKDQYDGTYTLKVAFFTMNRLDLVSRRTFRIGPAAGAVSE